jgi:hypothetical protein
MSLLKFLAGLFHKPAVISIPNCKLYFAKISMILQELFHHTHIGPLASTTPRRSPGVVFMIDISASYDQSDHGHAL